MRPKPSRLHPGALAVDDPPALHGGLGRLDPSERTFQHRAGIEVSACHFVA
jgi:hypothetical protein